MTTLTRPPDPPPIPDGQNVLGPHGALCSIHQIAKTVLITFVCTTEAEAQTLSTRFTTDIRSIKRLRWRRNAFLIGARIISPAAAAWMAANVHLDDTGFTATGLFFNATFFTLCVFNIRQAHDVWLRVKWMPRSAIPKPPDWFIGQ